MFLMFLTTPSISSSSTLLQLFKSFNIQAELYLPERSWICLWTPAQGPLFLARVCERAEKSFLWTPWLLNVNSSECQMLVQIQLPSILVVWECKCCKRARQQFRFPYGSRAVPLWCNAETQRASARGKKNWRFRKFYTFPAPMTAVQPILISKVRMVGEAIVHIVFGDSKWTSNRFRTVWERLPFLYKCGKLLDAPLNALLHRHTHTMYEILKQNLCISGTCYLQSPASSSGKAKERHPPKSLCLDKISNTI